jgi:hypothetical protein
VLMMGPWAIWAMVELEWQSDAAMAEPREQYPSGAVRLELMAATAAAVKLDPEPALRGLRPRDIASRSEAGRRDVTFAHAVVAASMEPLPFPAKPTTLARLCNFQATYFQASAGKPSQVKMLRQALVAGQVPATSASLDGPRLGAAASLAAWSDVMATADDSKRSSLSEQSLRLITQSGPPGTRASEATVDAVGAVAGVVGSLLAAGRQELEE